MPHHHDHHHLESPPVFELKGVGLHSPSHRARPPLFDSLNWDLREGEIFGVIGPSGSGKTTFLKLLAGLLSPTSGEVRFRGHRIEGFSREQVRVFRRCIGMTFQRSGLFDSMTAAENLDFPLREWGVKDPKQRREQIERALEDVGLAGQGNLQIHEMSGGMQKRLGIARALALAPEVILYDDPTAGLDPITSRAILELILSVKEKTRMTVCLVTSEVGLACRLCDRLGLLSEGSFVEVASQREFVTSEDPQVRRFLGGVL